MDVIRASDDDDDDDDDDDARYLTPVRVRAIQA